jgi:carnitine 3-dehydrogenase
MNVALYKDPAAVRSVAVLGTGAVGASWIALFLAHGLHVVAYDPSGTAPQRVADFVTHAWPALRELGRTSLETPPLDRIQFADTPADAARRADVIQENCPEHLDVKQALLAEVDAAATPDKIILSSTGGIPPTEMQKACAHPERLLVLHPFNPTHLIPLVEIVGGQQTSPLVIEWAAEFARLLHKQPIVLHAEASGHMANRLQFALVREAVACLVEGIASAQDIDAAVRYGLGPRWALMGSLLTLHLAGGPGGMQGILDHTAKAIQDWWTPRNTPELNPEVVAQLVEAAAAVSRGEPVSDWVQWRDEGLVKVLKLQEKLDV